MFFSCTQSTIPDELAFTSLRQAARSNANLFEAVTSSYRDRRGTILTESRHFPRDAQRDTHLTEVALQARSMLSLFLVRDQKYLYLMKMGEQGKVLSSLVH
jgi:hypothetical protein